MSQFQRTELLIGEKALEVLEGKRVAIFGLGGVGGYVCEALVRAGIGAFDLIDKDIIDETNINRQIIALNSTIGKNKVDVMKERMLDINKAVKITTYKKFLLPENIDEFPFESYDYIIDAIDTIAAKIELVKEAYKKNIPIISAMGAGNKLSASKLRISDLFATKVCPVAKIMRNELKKFGIDHLKVVYSEEMPIKVNITEEKIYNNSEFDDTTMKKKKVIGSISYVPAVKGFLMAEVVIKDLIEYED